MRRPIAVYGVTLSNEEEVTTDDEGILSIKVNPDRSVDVTHTDSIVERLSYKCVTYSPRYN